MRLNLKTKCLTLLFKKIRITDDETLIKLLLLLVRSTFALFFRSRFKNFEKYSFDKITYCLSHVKPR